MVTYFNWEQWTNSVPIERLIMQNETFYAWKDTFHVCFRSVLHICTMASMQVQVQVLGDTRGVFFMPQPNSYMLNCMTLLKKRFPKPDL